MSVLHHIPNVSEVVAELGRVTKTNGYTLIREPIVSMGDWRYQRKPGLTKRERGIPLHLLGRIVSDAGFTIERNRVCCFPGIPRVGRVLKRSAYDSAALTAIDDVCSQVLRPLYRYHAERAWQKVRPTAVFVVARKR